MMIIISNSIIIAASATTTATTTSHTCVALQCGMQVSRCPFGNDDLNSSNNKSNDNLNSSNNNSKTNNICLRLSARASQSSSDL
jgi:hypothetical protein